MLYLDATFHDPLAFVHAQKGWDRSLELPWDTFFHFFDGRLTLESGLHSLTDLSVHDRSASRWRCWPGDGSARPTRCT